MSAIRVDISAAFRTRWYEYAVRFFFGGLITVAAGLVARQFGPSVGGLFLAFPAIFPASATLVDKHEKQKKERAGMRAGVRGRMAASLDARGAAMGSSGLIIFALVVWRALDRVSMSTVLSLAVVSSLATSIALWCGRRLIRS
jgi:hypothetical protein